MRYETMKFPPMQTAFVEDNFTKYLLYDGKTVYTGCCHRKEDLDWTYHHGETEACPFCGERLEVRNLRKYRKQNSLDQYFPVVFLSVSEDGEEITADCFWTKREPIGNPFQETRCRQVGKYRFRRGIAEMWEEQIYEDRMVRREATFFHEPFYERQIPCGYSVYGMEELEHSFLRYIPFGKPRNTLMRFLHLASLHPEQTEMLLKMGVREPVEDWIWCRRKNADVIRWNKTGAEAFGLTKGELRAYLKTGKGLNVLRAYRMLKKEIPISECGKLNFGCGMRKFRAFLQTGDELGISPKKLLAYRQKQTCFDGMWLDYLEAAEALGYDLGNPLIQMPGDLKSKHDEAVQERKILIEKETEERASRLYRERVEKYSYSDGEVEIVVPVLVSEIVDEGKALHHCVGGYANRHANGVLTILFLRKCEEPEIPFVTIEMHGNQMIQAHGDHNNMDDVTAHRGFLDRWLNWVKNGSRRKEIA